MFDQAIKNALAIEGHTAEGHRHAPDLLDLRRGENGLADGFLCLEPVLAGLVIAMPRFPVRRLLGTNDEMRGEARLAANHMMRRSPENEVLVVIVGIIAFRIERRLVPVI